MEHTQTMPFSLRGKFTAGDYRQQKKNAVIVRGKRDHGKLIARH